VIDSLTEFTVVPEYHRSRTLYHVYSGGSRTPVAQARIDRAPDTLRPLEVFTGPGLDQPAGWVNSFSARGPDRVMIGEVNSRFGLVGKAKWVFAQDGLPEMQGKRAGVTNALRDGLPMVRDILTGGIADAALSAHLRFSGPDCPGFEFTRPPGIKTRYKVRVHDRRVSRLLVLAAILNYDFRFNADPRKDASALTSNPFKI
jgi:hypothetical protein